MKDGPRLEAPPAGPREQRDEHRAVVHAGDADTGVFSSAGWRAPQKAEMNASGERECSPASEGRFLPARALSDGWLLAWDQDGWSVLPQLFLSSASRFFACSEVSSGKS